MTSRHEAFVAGEVSRVLVPGGVFLTQQVGGDYGGFYDALDLPRPVVLQRRWDPSLAEEQLAGAGMQLLDFEEATESVSFADVGALAWYLKMIPWTVENFSIEAQRPQLERLHGRMATGGPLRVELPAFWLKAVKSS